jgi:GNAT superfamily N-acetyltransferase
MPKLETTVTFLEMKAEPLLQAAAPSRTKLMLMRAETPSVRFYRYLYDAVGRDYYWIDRKRLSDAALAKVIHSENVEVWVAYAAGEPAGYFEIEARASDDETELMYLGLMPEFQGLGLGKWLLAEAIRACWARKPRRVIVQTCTLDGPAALPLYQKFGFLPYARELKVTETAD